MQGVDIVRGDRRILAGVSLRVHAGEIVVLRGRSGSGKTSVLSAAAGLIAPAAGSIHVAGHDVRREPGATRRKHIGLVFQNLRLLPELTLQENIELGLRLARAPKGERIGRSRQWMERLDILNLASRRPQEVSGGEQQRAAIARAMVMRPDLLLVDEPTSALDRETARSVVAALHTTAKAGAGIAVATHDDVVTGHRLLHVANGKVTQA